MTKWEYKFILRSRHWSKVEGYLCEVATDWDVDIEKTLKELGEDGWELVAVAPRSSYLGASEVRSYINDYAGFTSNELWVFKRPKTG